MCTLHKHDDFRCCQKRNMVNIIDCMFCVESIANGTPQSVHFWAKHAFPHNTQQQRAFEILAAKFVLLFCDPACRGSSISDSCSHAVWQSYCQYIQLLKDMVGKPACVQQLVMFLTGPVGSGKSEIITQVKKYRELFCANIKQPFPTGVILCTSNTACAVVSDYGVTMHSIVFQHFTTHQFLGGNPLQFCDPLKMLIVDDVETLSVTDLELLDKRLRLLQKNSSAIFGGVDVVFVGDFCQLPPVARMPLYNTKCPLLRSSVNCYVNLKYPCEFGGDLLLHEICQ